MLDAILQALRLSIKCLFLSIPLIIISLIISFGNGSLEYRDVRNSVVTVYETASSVVETLSYENLQKVSSFASSLIDNPSTDDVENDGWLSMFFKSGLQYVIDAIRGIFDGWVILEPTG